MCMLRLDKRHPRRQLPGYCEYFPAFIFVIFGFFFCHLLLHLHPLLFAAPGSQPATRQKSLPVGTLMSNLFNYLLFFLRQSGK